VEENRLYQQTARSNGDTAMASTLDELQRILLDVANSPDEVTPSQFESIRNESPRRDFVKVRWSGRNCARYLKAGKPRQRKTIHNESEDRHEQGHEREHENGRRTAESGNRRIDGRIDLQLQRWAK